ncbi:MAG: DUF72 domain-containing protein [Cyclobacteriaceae bacterium]
MKKIMSNAGKIYIGTSGWHYKHWLGTFYPDDMKSKDFIHFYKERLDTVEINNSFYRLPAEDTFASWKDKVPESFIFAVKGSRYITHIKRLKSPIKDSLDLFLQRSMALNGKLGPILFQLPPSMKFNQERLASFLPELPDNLRFTIEFRNPEWYNNETRELLKQYNIAFCWYELAFHQSPAWVTSDFIYVRLHGPDDKYQGSYEDYKLEEWAHKLKKYSDEGIDVYCYFDNDQFGYAPHNAMQLKQLCY